MTYRITTDKPRRPFSPIAAFFAALALLLMSALNAPAASPSVAVQLDITHAAPRGVEKPTARRILADYRFAWTNLARAVAANSAGPTQGLFTGTAKKWLDATIASQRQSGLVTKYLNQNHNLEAIFYAPEGDVMELHDTAQYQMQIFDGGKLIYDQPVVMHYVVLMTPGADRWLIRQLQPVAKF
ncbi:MAG TPA: hypothetical protein VMD99_13340 [Terriglobales bacterium]|nr:hypothetical protein [Terriglobales bacterium]